MLENNTVKENTTPDYMSNIPALMVQAHTHLQFAEWKKAAFLFDRVISASPDTPEGYLGRLLATLKLKDEQELATCTKPYTELELYKTLMAKATVDLYNRLAGYAEATAEERAKNASKPISTAEDSVFVTRPWLVPTLHAVGAVLGLLLISLLTMVSEYRYWPILLIASVPAIDVFTYYLLTARLYADKQRNGAIPFFVLLADALLVFVLSCLPEVEYFDDNIFALVFGLAFVAIVCVGYYFAFIRYMKITPSFLRALIPFAPEAVLGLAAGVFGPAFYKEYEPILFHLFIIFVALALAYAPAVAAVQLIKKKKLIGILPAAASAAILLTFAFLFFITPYTYEKNSDGYTATGTRNPGLNVNIPAEHLGKPVTEIGHHAFAYCFGLTSVAIPDSVTSIGERAFYDCSSLTSITVSADNGYYKSIDGNLYTKDGKTLIQYAIGKTETAFTIPNGVESIGDYAFWDCTSLRDVTITDSVTSIGNYAFSWCTGLTSVTIGNGVTSIGDYAFHYCDSLRDVTIPGSIVRIGDNAFSACWNLYSVEISEGVTEIGESAFANSHYIQSITIPASVTDIGQRAFYYCARLTVNYCGTEEQWNSIANYIFTRGTTVTVNFNYVPAE